MQNAEILRYLMQCDDISISNDIYFLSTEIDMLLCCYAVVAVSIETYIVRMLTGDELVNCIVL